MPVIVKEIQTHCTETRRLRTRSVCLLPFENSFFLSQQKVKAEQSFSMGLFVGWVIDREARKLSGARGRRSNKVERSANAQATPGWTASVLIKGRFYTIDCIFSSSVSSQRCSDLEVQNCYHIVRDSQRVAMVSKANGDSLLRRDRP